MIRMTTVESLLASLTFRGRRRLAAALFPTLIAVTLLLAVASALAADAPKAKGGKAEEAATEYLLRHYPKVEKSIHRPWFERGTSLKDVELKALPAGLPNVKFLVTTLMENSEFPEIGTVVAVRQRAGGDWDSIGKCLSPLYADPNDEFLAIFRDATAKSPAEREALVGDIGRLFAAIIYEGSVKGHRVVKSEHRIDLYHGDNIYRTIIVAFGTGSKITSVRLINPNIDRVREEAGKDEMPEKGR